MLRGMAVLFTDYGGPLPPENTHLNGFLSKDRKFLQNDLANSAKATYGAGQRRYMKFCKAAGKSQLQSQNALLTLFMTYLATHNISLATIKVYLSAVHHMHYCRSLHDHFITPQLQLILRGIKKRQACIRRIRQRLPVTIQMLHRIRHLLSNRTSSYTNTTL